MISSPAMGHGELRGRRRILLLSASAGAGHVRAAQAVEAACRNDQPAVEVRHVDVLQITPPAFSRLYGRAYLDFVNHAPELVGIVYDRTNRSPRHGIADRVRLAVDRLNTRPLVKLLSEYAPDVVCHTHFLPAEIFGHRLRRGRENIAHAVVVTDFEVHRFWIAPRVSRYFVAREDNRVHLAALGVSDTSVDVTGIPIDPVFAETERLDPKTLRAKHNVDSTRPLVLILGGGFGVGPVEDLVIRLAAGVAGAQIVVVAGRNEDLRRRLTRVARGLAVPTRVLGYTTEIHEWMTLAAVLVTKPGGLTTSEALALGVPIVVVNAIPGQETRNATMLYEEGAAISGENPLTLGRRLSDLLRSPQRLAAMRDAARRLGRPDAAARVAASLVALAGRPA